MERPQRNGPTETPREEDPEPQVPPECHSGEGVASVLEVLQKLERPPEGGKPPEPQS